MAYNLQQCQKMNTADEPKTDDDDDGKIIYLNIQYVTDIISKVWKRWYVLHVNNKNRHRYFHSPNHSNLTDFQAKPSTSKATFEPKCKRRKKKISQEDSGPSPSDENGENDGSKISLQNF